MTPGEVASMGPADAASRHPSELSGHGAVGQVCIFPRQILQRQRVVELFTRALLLLVGP
jgi:hypothetical protein